MSVHTEEREFHDALAATLITRGLALRGPDRSEAALLNALGDIEGRTVLDLGCGAGDLTLMLAERGARVTALDISPGMVELAQKRAAIAAPHADVQFVVAAAEATGLPSETFDVVIGKWILHHLDVSATAAEIARLLRPGGRGIFIETSAINPLLRFARRRLAGRFGIPRFGTPDEHPLGNDDYAILAARFSQLRLTFPDFLFFRLFNRQVLRARYRRPAYALRGMDRFVWHKLPALRRYSYYVMAELERGACA